jgi:dihydroneopterin aldolase
VASPDHAPDVTVVTTRLFVRGVRAMASIGIHHRERTQRQQVVIDVELTVAQVGRDRIEETTDYGLVLIAVTETIAEGHVDLVEIFAERIGRCLLVHNAIEAITVRVTKPQALIPDADAAGVEIHLRRN